MDVLEKPYRFPLNMKRQKPAVPGENHLFPKKVQ